MIVIYTVPLKDVVVIVKKCVLRMDAQQIVFAIVKHLALLSVLATVPLTVLVIVRLLVVLHIVLVIVT